MTIVPAICAVASLPVAWFAGVLIDRVPGNDPFRPLPGVRTRGWYLFLYVAMAVLFAAMGHRFDDDPALVIIGYLLLISAVCLHAGIWFMLLRRRRRHARLRRTRAQRTPGTAITR